MKKNDISEMRAKSIEDLKKMLVGSQKEEARANLELAMMRQTNRHAAQVIRKKNAVLQTIIREKELVGSK